MPTEKTEDLFKLSNAALKERLTQEGIPFETDDNKKTLVSRLNGDFKPAQSDEDAEAEKAALEGKADEANPVVDERGDSPAKSEPATAVDANVEVTTAQAVSDAETRKAAEGSSEPEKLIGLEGVDDNIELIDGNQIHVDEVVKLAFAKSGLSVKEWNALTDLERWRAVTPVLDEKQKELYEARAAREDSAGKDETLAKLAAQNEEAAASKEPELPVTEASFPDVTGNSEPVEDSHSATINRLELEKGALQAVVKDVSAQNQKLTQLLGESQKTVGELTQRLADTQLNIDKANTLHGHIDDVPKPGLIDDLPPVPNN